MREEAVQLRIETGEAERLAELEREQEGVFLKLAGLAEEQKRLVAGSRRIERERKKLLEGVPEHTVPQDRELTLEDVEAWCRTAFFNQAHSMPSNPHAYFSRKKSREPSMYERVVGFVIENGYDQTYYGSTYRALDIRLNGSDWYCWAMTDDATKSEVLNLKPRTMPPTGEERRRKGTAG